MLARRKTALVRDGKFRKSEGRVCAAASLSGTETETALREKRERQRKARWKPLRTSESSSETAFRR